MTRIFIFLFSFIVIVESLFSQPEPRDTLANIKKATVYIQVNFDFPLSGDKVPVNGSGFLVSDNGIIVTNYHVIQPLINIHEVPFPVYLKDIKIIINSGTSDYKSYIASVINVDKTNDLALLKINDTVKTPFIEIDYNENLSTSAPVTVFGYPFGEEFTVLQRGPEITINKGFITSIRHDDLDKISKIQIDAVVKPGNSGGPLINAKGKVTGIVNLIYGASGMNFAIPTHFLKPLLDSISKSFSYKDSVEVKVISSPESAMVFDNSKYKGNAPVSFKVLPGWHQITTTKDGFQNNVTEKAILHNSKINCELFKAEIIIVPGNSETKQTKNLSAGIDDKPLPFGYSIIKDFYKENFNNAEDFKKWKQNTGGEDKRTWFIENGILNQFESDGVLHAISMGDTLWDNYEMTAKVKITDKHDDSRAGLIFRENKDGFYLFRIHKESKKAQLAYHSKNPFGWFILTEKELNKDVADNWFDLKVTAAGNNINCYFDTACIISTSAGYSQRGNIGFYSVESKASFDSISVKNIKINNDIPQNSKSENLLSFWLSDYFNQKSVFWKQYLSDNTPFIWDINDGGFIDTTTDKKTRYCELSKYKLSDFILNLIVSFAEKDTNSLFEIYFRKDDKNSLVIRISNKDKKISLLQKEGNTEKLLQKKTLPLGFFNSTKFFTITANKNSVKFSSYYSSYIDYKSNKILQGAGFISVAVSDLKTILHQVQISSVKDQTVKPEK
ncbi:MAG: trypsin-like peptidase domain-containing protein [Bacteroidales bacterium]|nr:trypsin-like peptidase domain-containing protein [Bacteroidales bacterium]